MGKITGFLEYSRLEEPHEPPSERVRHFGEFHRRLPDGQASVQAARCMDCGIPFCVNGCPVNNIIPDWNDLVYRGDWRRAIEVLHATNNFPEFTGRVCPAPCEEACTLRINDAAVGIKSIEHAIADKAWEEGWILPERASRSSGRRVAIVGSGPAGLACAQQLARAAHAVTVYEKNDRIGGLLRYGIPDFKLGKDVVDRRLAQLRAEGVEFRTGVCVGPRPAEAGARGVIDWSRERLSAAELLTAYDAVVLAAGSEVPRDLPIAGRDLAGIHFAMEFLAPQNRRVAGDRDGPELLATGRHVIVIGGGDTGSDCVGTANRQGARSVTQLELLPMPPDVENNPVWPYWPTRLRTSTSHEEGVEREWSVATKAFLGENGRVRALRAVRLRWSEEGKAQEIPGSEFELRADLVLLAMGFVSPLSALLADFGVERDARGNARAHTEGPSGYATSRAKVFAAGDVRRGQSLVVWAIREGRQCARAVDEFLMGESRLPR